MKTNPKHVLAPPEKKSPAGGDGASLPQRPAGGLGSDRQKANATSRRGVHSSAITCALSTEHSGSLALLVRQGRHGSTARPE